MIQPNAGLPCLHNGETCYHVTSDEYANNMREYMDNGVSIVGGCCGTTPDFIAELKRLLPVLSQSVVLKNILVFLV